MANQVITGQVYFDDIAEGMNVPPFERGVVEMPDIIRFTTSIENHEYLHQDYKWCVEHGYPDVLVNGPLKNSMLSVMLTNWIGEGGFLKKLGCQHRGMDIPGNTLTATGTVTRKYEQDGLGYVDLDVKVENQRGEATCIGTATVILPRRTGPAVPTAFPTPR
jgi:acyl dehydratase